MERKEGREGRESGLKDLVKYTDDEWRERLKTPVIENFEPDYGDSKKSVVDLSTRGSPDSGHLIAEGFSAIPVDVPPYGVLKMCEVKAYFAAVRESVSRAKFKGLAAYGAWEAYDRLEKAMPFGRYLTPERKAFRDKVMKLIEEKKEKAFSKYAKVTGDGNTLKDPSSPYFPGYYAECPKDYGKTVNAVITKYAPGLKEILRRDDVKIVVGKIPLSRRHRAAGIFFSRSGVCLVSEKHFKADRSFDNFGVDVLLHELEHAARDITGLADYADTSYDEAKTDLMTVSRRGPDAHPSGYYAPFTKSERMSDVAEVYKAAGILKEGSEPTVHAAKKFRKLPYEKQSDAVYEAYPRTFIRHMRTTLDDVIRVDKAPLSTTLKVTTSEGDAATIFFERPVEVTEDLKTEVKDAIDRMDGERGEETVEVEW